MKRRRIWWVITLSVLIINGCGKKASDAPPKVAPELEGYVYYKNPVYLEQKPTDCRLENDKDATLKKFFACVPSHKFQTVSFKGTSLSNQNFKFRPHELFIVDFEKDDPEEGLSIEAHELLGAKEAKPVNNSWKFEFAHDPDFKFVQFHLAYWLREAQGRLKAFAPGFLNKTLHVFPLGLRTKEGEGLEYFDNAAFISDGLGSDNHFLVFGHYMDEEGRVGLPLSLDVDVAVHELGHAFIHHVNPSLEDEKCENSKVGCVDAIHEGSADFIAFLQYKSSNPIMGELSSNSVAGMNHDYNFNDPKDEALVFPRNFKEFLEKDFDLEKVAQIPDVESHGLGTVWGTFWYKLWVEVESAEGKAHVEKLFHSHFSLLNNRSTFKDAVQLLLALDYKEGKYNSLIQDAALKLKILKEEDRG